MVEELPEGYDSVKCDVCDDQFLQNKLEGFYHCELCAFDACTKCCVSKENNFCFFLCGLFSTQKSYDRIKCNICDDQFLQNKLEGFYHCELFAFVACTKCGVRKENNFCVFFVNF